MLAEIFAVLAMADRPWRSLPVPCQSVTITTVADPAVDTSHAWGYQSGCEIWIDPGLLKDRQWLCTVLMHELGHLRGVRHSSNRRSVMYPILRRIDRRCVY